MRGWYRMTLLLCDLRGHNRGGINIAFVQNLLTPDGLVFMCLTCWVKFTRLSQGSFTCQLAIRRRRKRKSARVRSTLLATPLLPHSEEGFFSRLILSTLTSISWGFAIGGWILRWKNRIVRFLESIVKIETHFMLHKLRVNDGTSSGFSSDGMLRYN